MNLKTVKSMLYKTALNLSALSVLGVTVWIGGLVFQHHSALTPVEGSILFLATTLLFILLCRLVARNSQRTPSMFATVSVLTIVLIVFALAGVQPFESYKSAVVSVVSEALSKIPAPATGQQAIGIAPEGTYIARTPSLLGDITYQLTFRGDTIDFRIDEPLTHSRYETTSRYYFANAALKATTADQATELVTSDVVTLNTERTPFKYIADQDIIVLNPDSDKQLVFRKD